MVTHGLGARGAGAVFTGVAAFTIVSNALKLGADTALVRFVSRDLERTGGAGVPGLLRTAVLPTLLASAAGAAVVLFSPVSPAGCCRTWPPDRRWRCCGCSRCSCR
ncbi:hypothetical protein PQR15_00825 [Streptomyces lydicus]|nr:hypothetical protein [Streptomyces lydicus]